MWNSSCVRSAFWNPLKRFVSTFQESRLAAQRKVKSPNKTQELKPFSAVVQFTYVCGVHAGGTGRTCPFEVRHAGWKIPLKHLQNNSTLSPSSSALLFPALSLISPTQGFCSRFIRLYLPLSRNPRADSVSFHPKLDSEASLFTEGSTSMPVFFFSSPSSSSFFAPLLLTPQLEEGKGERSSLFWVVSSSSAGPGAAAPVA